jgi:hypothetical protein
MSEGPLSSNNMKKIRNWCPLNCFSAFISEDCHVCHCDLRQVLDRELDLLDSLIEHQQAH